MENPFVLPNRGRIDSRPLSPWEVKEHEDYYVPVDSTQEQFKRFKEDMADVDVASVGQVVLSSGQEGCGKTALINRCAHWLQKTLSEDRNLDTSIIDLSAERMPAIGADDQAAQLCNLIKVDIQFKGLFSEGDLQDLQRKDAFPQAVFLLSKLLAFHNKCLIVLFPPLETYEALRSYFSFARPNIVLFCESAYDHVIKAAERAKVVGDDPVILLSVGLLDIEDGWSFAKSRLDLWQARNRGGAPTIEEETIRRFMEDRKRGRGGTNVRELQRTLMAVFDEVLKKRATSVEYQDFKDYYMQKAVLS